MTVWHIISGLGQASGVTTFVVNVREELLRLGHQAEIVCLSDAPAVCLPKTVDLVHLHGLWDLRLRKWAKEAKRQGVPVVWSPHGMLQLWALKNKWYKKLAALALYQWRDLHAADLLHATAQSEVEDIRRLHLRNPVVVAPLGVAVSPLRNEDSRLVAEDAVQSPLVTRTLLFVSRVQRKKGLPNLLSAWAQLPVEERRHWHIRIVGPDQDNHTAELRTQAERLRIQAELTFVGPKYGADLAAEYDAADLFVLPTHSENFGSVVIEALAHGVPVICTKAAPWSELETEGCGWWVDDSVAALKDALLAALQSAEILPGMGMKGRALVQERYTWPAVAQMLVNAYAGIARHA